LPIKTTITADANPEALKASIALLDRYQAALTKLYGRDVLKAPHVASVSAASKDLAEFLKHHEAAAKSAAATGERFARMSQSVGKHFSGLAGNVEKSVANFTRFALTPLEAIVGEGALGGLALGAGLLTGGIALAGYAGYKAWQALEGGAADVTGRRRQAMGLGVGYGALSSYDLNFNRFGLGAETLGAVAGGVYDVTSPQFLPLLTSGAATGDTASAAVALIQNLPAMLKNVPDGMVGPTARSRGWDQILPMSAIVALKNADPAEIQRQIAHYNSDKATLDISAQAAEKWASFDTTINRAGRKIETVLAGQLAPLAEPLTHMSASVDHIITALIDTGLVSKGLGVIDHGLEAFGDAIGSHNFHEDGKKFKAAIDALYPYLPIMAKVAAFEVRFGVVGARLLFDPSYNPTASELLGAFLGVKEPSREVPPVPHVNYDRNPSGRPSIRYGTRGAGGPTVDSETGKIVHDFHGMPFPNRNSSPDSVAGIPAASIVPGPRETPSDLYDRIRALYPHLTNEECVELARKAAGIHEGVRDWRRGVNVNSANLPPGTPLATFMDRQGQPSDLYDGGQGVGAPGNNTTHAAVFMGYTKDGILVDEQYRGSGGPHLQEYKFGDKRGGEKDANNYFSINDLGGLPAGENNPFRREVQAQIAANRFAGGAESRSRYFAAHTPAAAGINPHIPAGPLVIYDHSGGSISIESSNVHTAQ
jgi:hypothetical protein